MEVSTILVTATRDLFSPVCGAISVCFDTDCGCSFCERVPRLPAETVAGPFMSTKKIESLIFPLFTLKVDQ